jgi:hypothetical protein
MFDKVAQCGQNRNLIFITHAKYRSNAFSSRTISFLISFMWDGNQPTVFNLNIQAVYRKVVISFYSYRTCSNFQEVQYQLLYPSVPISLLWIWNIANAILHKFEISLRACHVERLDFGSLCDVGEIMKVLWAKNCVTVTIPYFCINVFFSLQCLPIIGF